MKQARSPAPAPARPPRRKAGTVEAYLAALPEPKRARLQRLREIIRASVPAEAVETISYGIPAFAQGGILVWFGAFEGHCSLFPTARVVAAFAKELAGYDASKGTVRFPAERPIPAALVRKLVRARVAQRGGGRARRRDT